MASKKIKIEGSKEKGVQGEGKSELLRVEVGGLRAKSFQLSVGALEQALLAEFPAADAEEWDRTGDNTRSVAVGLERTGRLVTAASGLLAITFIAFATSGITRLRQVPPSGSRTSEAIGPSA